MSDIDWLAVDWVVSGQPMNHLKPAEKRMVVRRLDARMRTQRRDGITASEVAQRLGTTARSVERMVAAMQPGVRSTCPVCREPMWVVAGVVEDHPDALFVTCPMSGQETVRGLAAHRPDLYRWLEVSA